MAIASWVLTSVLCLVPSAVQVSGRVLALDGKGIAGAQVVARDDANEEVVVTDANGAFTLTSVSLPATFDITADGFAPAHRVVSTSPIDIVLSPASVVESVVVTADRTPIWRDPMSGATVLSRLDVERVPALTVDDTLRAVSGFSLFRRSASRASNPTTHGVTMRGLSASGSSRGLILLDGVPLNDGFGGWVTWTRLPPFAIDRIDVDRGAAGDAFGTDALGGVIRIIGVTGDVPVARVSVQGGSTGVAGADASVGQRARGASLFGAASWFRSDGTIPLAAESRGPVDAPADVDWINGFGRLDVVRPTGRLIVFGWGGRDDRGNGTILQRNRMRGGTLAATYSAVRAQTLLAARASTSPNRFFQTFTAVQAGRATETLTSTQVTDTTTTRALVEAGRSVSRLFLLARATVTRADADFNDVRLAGTTNQRLRDDSEAASLEVGYSATSALRLSAGARHEWRAAPTRDDGRDEATVGHVSAAWRAGDQVHVRGSVATSHRWPTLNELVRNFQVGAIVTQANPALLPERSRSMDLMVSLHPKTGGRWLFTTGAFWAVVEDAISNVTISPVLRARRNAGEARSRGAEVDGELRFAGRARLRASVTYADAIFQNATEEAAALEGLRLPQVPKLSGAISGELTLHGSLVVSALWHSASSQFDDDRNQFLLAEAHRIDLRVAGRWRHFGMQLVLENGLDRRIEVGRTPLVTLAPGRAVRVGIDWRR